MGSSADKISSFYVSVILVGCFLLPKFKLLRTQDHTRQASVFKVLEMESDNRRHHVHIY